MTSKTYHGDRLSDCRKQTYRIFLSEMESPDLFSVKIARTSFFSRGSKTFLTRTGNCMPKSFRTPRGGETSSNARQIEFLFVRIAPRHSFFAGEARDTEGPRPGVSLGVRTPLSSQQVDFFEDLGSEKFYERSSFERDLKTGPCGPLKHA